VTTRARANLDHLHPGDTATCRLDVTPDLVAQFAAWSLDDNPLHMDDEVAKEYGFSGRVAHGMLAMGAISRLIGTQLPGPGSLWVSQEVQFPAAVMVGDQLQAKATVQGVSRGAQIATLAVEAANCATGVVVLRGTAKVRVPPRQVNAGE
jgi:acyl dehydratase